MFLFVYLSKLTDVSLAMSSLLKCPSEAFFFLSMFLMSKISFIDFFPQFLSLCLHYPTLLECCHFFSLVLNLLIEVILNSHILSVQSLYNNCMQREILQYNIHGMTMWLFVVQHTWHLYYNTVSIIIIIMR